jgi:hypothetical protein
VITKIAPRHRLFIVFGLLAGALLLTLWVAVSAFFSPGASLVKDSSCDELRNRPATDISTATQNFCVATDPQRTGQTEFGSDPTGYYWQLDGSPGSGITAYRTTGADPEVWMTQSSPPPRDAWWVVGYLAAACALALVLLRAREPAPPSAPVPPPGGLLPQPPPLPSVPQPKPRPKPARAVRLAASTSSGVTGLAVDRGRIGPFDVYAASQVGLQHAKDGDPREDAYAVGGDPDRGRVFLAVADGLGSTKDAHAAARRASKTALDLLRSRFDDDRVPPPEEWTQIATDVVAQVAQQLDPDAVGDAALDIGYLSPQSRNGSKAARPPACTLTFAVAGPHTGDGYPVYWAGVGDCELLFVDLDRGGTLTWKTHNATKTGTSVSNVTDSLPRNPDRIFYGAEMVSPETMVVVTSDGVGDAIRQVPEEFSRLLGAAATAGLTEPTFAELVSFDIPGLHDDRTLVAAWPSYDGAGVDRGSLR